MLYIAVGRRLTQRRSIVENVHETGSGKLLKEYSVRIVFAAEKTSSDSSFFFSHKKEAVEKEDEKGFQQCCVNFFANIFLSWILF